MNILRLAMGLILLGAPAFSAVATFNTLADFQAAASGLTLIDFDTDPSNNSIGGGTLLGSIYSSVGVVFPSGNFVSDAFAGPHSAPNGWLNSTNRYFDATFPGSITAVGVFNIEFAGTSTLSAFDASDNLLGTVVSDSNTNSIDFFGLTSTTSIARITVTTPSGGWGLDDLYIGSSASVANAPEPGTALLLSGAAALLYIRRRRLLR